MHHQQVQQQQIRADVSQQGPYQQQPQYGGPAQYNPAQPMQPFEYGMAGGQMAHVEPHMLGPASGMPGADVQPIFQQGPMQEMQAPFEQQQQQPLNGGAYANGLHLQDLHECASLLLVLHAVCLRSTQAHQACWAHRPAWPAEAPQQQGQARGEPRSRLFIAGLPADITQREVAHILRPFEGFKALRLVPSKQPTAKRPMLCFAEFDSPLSASRALEMLQVSLAAG
jgi:hypothetical protein